MTTKFMRKPHEVLAIQATRKNYREIQAFVQEHLPGTGVLCGADQYVVTSEAHQFRHHVPILAWFVIDQDNDGRSIAQKLHVYAHNDFCAKFTPIGG